MDLRYSPMFHLRAQGVIATLGRVGIVISFSCMGALWVIATGVCESATAGLAGSDGFMCLEEEVQTVGLEPSDPPKASFDK